ncbi:MAG: hypothetical protein AAFN51_05620 [Pseudomonadota bacterium]
MSKKFVYTPEAQPAACWFIGGFIAVLGAGLLFTGLDNLEHDPTWMIPQIMFASALIFMGWRASQYHKRKVLALGKDAIERNPFWSLPKRYLYNEIDSFGFFEQDNKAKDFTKSTAGRATGLIVTSQHLVLKMKSGVTHEFVLPRFDNHALIAELQRRTGLQYQSLPRRSAG